MGQSSGHAATSCIMPCPLLLGQAPQQLQHQGRTLSFSSWVAGVAYCCEADLKLNQVLLTSELLAETAQRLQQQTKSAGELWPENGREAARLCNVDGVAAYSQGITNFEKQVHADCRMRKADKSPLPSCGRGSFFRHLQALSDVGRILVLKAS